MGLSGKLLVLTVLFVMAAEILIYVPAVAIFRITLNRHQSSAFPSSPVYQRAFPVFGNPTARQRVDRSSPFSKLCETLLYSLSSITFNFQNHAVGKGGRARIHSKL